MASIDTSGRILEAARECLLADGYAAMSTRKVADSAGVPLSQIHYHFGSKDELILAMLRHENDTLLQRQGELFARDIPVSQQWSLACDFLDEDLDSGYVRVFQEMVAAGWSSEMVGQEVKTMLLGWDRVLRELAANAERAGIKHPVFGPGDISALVGAVFLGAEAMILLGIESDQIPLRSVLRKLGQLIESAEGRTA